MDNYFTEFEKSATKFSATTLLYSGTSFHRRTNESTRVRNPDQLYSAGGWYPWTEDEIASKIQWCLGEDYHGEVGDRLVPVRDIGVIEAKVHKIVGSLDVGPTIDPKNHLRVAEQFVESCFVTDGHSILIHHQTAWHHWTGKRFEASSEDDIKSKLWKWLSQCKIWEKDKQTTFKPTRNVVSGVMDALKAVANVPSTLETPCWWSGGSAEVIAFNNGFPAPTSRSSSDRFGTGYRLFSVKRSTNNIK